ncbi:MAG TPA: RHS repeat-associated core domain-containing protein [Candidatus Sulfotelmatobacter sp.]|nr:RHS repeat-associated core domain-containing protein [Candidatus Sulfotelmatobacter sp.]
MPKVLQNSQIKQNSSEGFVWLAYQRTGFTILGNLSKSPTGLHGSARGPHGNASASPQKSDVGTDASGTVVETLDYYPYGAVRVDTQSGSYTEVRKYVGTEFDQGSGLNYMQARYQDPARGQFLSEDPSFLAVGNPNQVQQNTGEDQQSFLADPQQMNSYGYGKDNPITQKDPNGKIAFVDDVTLLGIGAVVLGGVALYKYESNVLLRNGGRIPEVHIPSPPTGIEDILKNINPNNLDPLKKWGLIGTVILGTGYTIWQQFKDEIAGIPSIFFGSSGPNNTSLPVPNTQTPTGGRPQPPNTVPPNRPNTSPGSSSGYSSQQLQSFQQQLNAIRATLNQIINTLTSKH